MDAKLQKKLLEQVEVQELVARIQTVVVAIGLELVNVKEMQHTC